MDYVPVEFPKEPPAHAYAVADIRPVNDRERALCQKAYAPDLNAVPGDLLYIGGLLAIDAAVVYSDNRWFRFMDTPAQRLVGPSLMGLAWGSTIGGLYLAMPKCRPDWVETATSEGAVRNQWQFAIALSLLSMATAPFIARIEQGPIREVYWDVPERSLTVIMPMITGAVGAFVPYLLPPRTWRAANELEKLRLNVAVNGNGLGLKLSF